MHHFLKYNFVNGRLGDPAILGQLVKHGQNILFDLGDLTALSKKDLNKTQYILLSHTHMDHFIGFERILRTHIPHRRRVTIVGPTGIAQQVRHRILGYTWNLIEDDQLAYQIHEVSDNRIVKNYIMSKGTNFEVIATKTTLAIPGASYKAINLSHLNIDSIAYQLVFPTFWKTNLDRILQDGLSPGPWISEVQQLGPDHQGAHLSISGKTFAVKDLIQRYFEPHYRSCCYLTDVGFTKDNLDKLHRYFSDTYLLFCESSFRHLDAWRAREKAHLTTKQAALIAALLGVKEFEPFHFSSIYGKDEKTTYDEAIEYWEQFRDLSRSELHKEIQEELM